MSYSGYRDRGWGQRNRRDQGETRYGRGHERRRGDWGWGQRERVPRRVDWSNIGGVERIPTGIPGLDELLEGGYPRGSMILYTGLPGSGKTIASLQFLYGLQREGGRVVYVSLEKRPERIIQQMRKLGWSPSPDRFIIVDGFTRRGSRAAHYHVKDPTDLMEYTGTITDVVRNESPIALVIDSVSTLFIAKPSLARRTVHVVKQSLSDADPSLTTIVISQVSAGETGYGGPGVEHAVDGVVLFGYYYSRRDDSTHRYIYVPKMEMTRVPGRRIPIEITDHGIVVKRENPASLASEESEEETLPA